MVFEYSSGIKLCVGLGSGRLFETDQPEPGVTSKPGNPFEERPIKTVEPTQRPSEKPWPRPAELEIKSQKREKIYLN